MTLDYQSIHFSTLVDLVVVMRPFFFLLAFLNKTETFILPHYQHSAKILYLAHQQLFNQFLSLFA